MFTSLRGLDEPSVQAPIDNLANRPWSAARRSIGHGHDVPGRIVAIGLFLATTGCGGVATGSAGQASARPSVAPTSATGPSAPASLAPSSSTVAPARIALTGRGPIGMAISGTTAWVVATDSGTLVGLDLAGRHEIASVSIGSGGTHVVIGDGDAVFVSRYATAGVGEHLVTIDGSGNSVGGIATGPLGGLAAGEDGTIWALEKTGRILHVDPVAGRVVAEVTIEIDADEHIELVAASGARWVSSDSTPVRRIAPDASVAAVIETGGGIPLAVADGLVWGARPDELWAIDPATNTVTRRIPLSDVIEILALDVAADEAWIAVRRPGRVGRVVQLALPDGRVMADHPVSLPAAVELADDRAWVTNYDGDEVLGFAR